MIKHFEFLFCAILQRVVHKKAENDPVVPDVTGVKITF